MTNIDDTNPGVYQYIYTLDGIADRLSDLADRIRRIGRPTSDSHDAYTAAAASVVNEINGILANCNYFSLITNAAWADREAAAGVVTVAGKKYRVNVSDIDGADFERTGGSLNARLTPVTKDRADD